MVARPLDLAAPGRAFGAPRTSTAAGCSFGDVVRATVYLADMADFATLNGIYAEAFGDHRPARSTVQAAALPKGARVEIDLVARRPG